MTDTQILTMFLSLLAILIRTRGRMMSNAERVRKLIDGALCLGIRVMYGACFSIILCFVFLILLEILGLF